MYALYLSCMPWMFVLGCTMVSGQEPRRHSIDTQMYSAVLVALKSTCWSSCWEYNPNNTQYKAKLNLNGDQIPADYELLLLYRMSINDIFYILLEIFVRCIPASRAWWGMLFKVLFTKFQIFRDGTERRFPPKHPSPPCNNAWIHYDTLIYTHVMILGWLTEL